MYLGKDLQQSKTLTIPPHLKEDGVSLSNVMKMGNLAYSNFSVGHNNAGLLEYVMGVLDDMERDADNHVDYPVALKKFVEVYGIDDFQKLAPENSFHWDNPVLDSFFPCFPSDEPNKSYDSVIKCMHRDIKTERKYSC